MKPARADDRLREAIERAWQAATGAWPLIRIDRQDFTAHLLARCDGASTDEARLDALTKHAADLYLACACARGDLAAIRVLDQQFIVALPPALMRLSSDRQLLDEALQQVRIKLLVGGNEGVPKIASYSGRAPLASWLKILATHATIDLLRRSRADVELADAQLIERLASLGDPEMEQLKARERKRVKAAFEHAFAALTEGERNLLRLSLLDELTVDQMAKLYGRHRLTIMRRLKAIRGALAREVERHLGRGLALDAEGLKELVGLVRSQLDLSLRRLLRGR
jgi:RNA polymerase sigma-70 factor (ECF subfamily)